MANKNAQWDENAAIVQEGLDNGAASDGTVEALLALTELKDISSLTKEQAKFLETAWELVDGNEGYAPGEKANLDGLDFDNVQGIVDFSSDELPNFGLVSCANFHQALQEGRVLEEKASVWRVPDSLGSVLSAARMLEVSVRERQLTDQLEATHPEPSSLKAALALDLDNAEVAQSTKMLQLAQDRKGAVDRKGEAERELQEQVGKNQVLLDRISSMQEQVEVQAGLHVDSYADLKELFKKLCVERNETNKRQSQAMLEAQAALGHLMHDKNELLAEVDTLYNQLAQTSGRQNRAAQAAAKEQDNLRSVRQLAKKREAALEEECRQLRERYESEKFAHSSAVGESSKGLERYRSETTAKIRLLEESLRLQDESEVVAEEARSQIKQEIQSKFDKQLRALLSEIEESESKSSEMAAKFKLLQGNLGKGKDELSLLKKDNERLGAENKAMRAREVKRRSKEEKMQELAATLVKEANANDNLAARLKATQSKLDDFTRRGLVSTTQAGSLKHAFTGGGGEEKHNSGASSRRLPVPSFSGSSGGARSADFNMEVQRKLDGLTADSNLAPFNQGSIFNGARANGSGSLGGSLKDAPPGPVNMGKAKGGARSVEQQQFI
mmetsp:Transcript_74461/g.149864  ORF Transcript_74461/g.149864 Transcript_74461/m.149864 type:complete len:613 (+) Transcript_74461:34-1872(+)